MTAKPVRLQLSRRKGFDLQKLSRKTNSLEAAVVARPTKWGSPFPLRKESDRARMIAKYRSYLRAHPALRAAARKELAGKNLACWCASDLACHAGVLLKIANARKASKERARKTKRV